MASQYPPETHGGVVTSWVPITTAWPSQSGCDQSFWSYVPSTIAGWDPGYGISVEPTLSCLPEGATAWWNQARLGPNSNTKISIGPIVCPEAYTTATTSAQDATSTLVACCPSGYTFARLLQDGNTGECVSELNPGQVITYAVRNQFQSWFLTTLSLESSTTIAGIQLNGWNVATVSSSAIPSTTTASPTTDTSSGNTSSDISENTKIGIGLGVSLGTLGLAALFAGIYWLFRRRILSRVREAKAQPILSNVEGKQELDSSTRAELPGG
ncbi:hypothetical protein EPUS_04770 [Endocarpon pusillum Z07020]|uniref:Uncharacterized protein n=1 Tax=Endocarpon pusillum (strain Z07020 / HMAS-L-300199) TaxID=1263415 RepID=U1G5V8_ENDPU|nr:uncharacterized protein EPUS_04770 [Endocarpon pusillum Z07020]ERF72717.1 hypothetical protein EPUS_04770 [Endocarpon pusillum Z07020]